ncbi:MAG: ANTAR domain-containing response regulator, partial [Acidimicrobiia bacterium]
HNNTAFSQLEQVEQARDACALAYLVKTFLRSELVTGIELAIGLFQEMQELLERNLELSEQLETRKIVDRAKGRLMDAHGLAEADAFSFVQRRAMSDRTTMREVAEGILDGSIVPDPGGRTSP